VLTREGGYVPYLGYIRVKDIQHTHYPDHSIKDSVVTMLQYNPGQKPYVFKMSYNKPVEGRLGTIQMLIRAVKDNVYVIVRKNAGVPLAFIASLFMLFGSSLLFLKHDLIKKLIQKIYTIKH
jgi:hypothetical protein